MTRIFLAINKNEFTQVNKCSCSSDTAKAIGLQAAGCPRVGVSCVLTLTTCREQWTSP